MKYSSIGIAAEATIPTVEKIDLLSKTQAHNSAELELIDRTTNTNKYWSAGVYGCEVLVRYGRIGSAGRALIHTFGSLQLAMSYFEKMLGEKIAKGYKISTTNPLFPQRISSAAIAQLHKLRDMVYLWSEENKPIYDARKAVKFLASSANREDSIDIGRELFPAEHFEWLIQFSDYLRMWKSENGVDESRFEF